MNLKNKKVIITGAGRGLGRKLIDKLIEKEAIISAFDIDEEALECLQKAHPTIYCRLCNVADSEQVGSAVNNVFEKFGAIDVLINNAALVRNSLLLNMTKEGIKIHDIGLWQKIIATDLSSVFYMTANVAKHMVEKRTKGVIVNISSVCAAGNAGQSAYSAAKAGINALTVTWAKELQFFKIRVAALAPGYVATQTTLDSVSNDAMKKILAQTPSRRIAEPREIIDGILFILENDFVNGRILELDGGLRL